MSHTVIHRISALGVLILAVLIAKSAIISTASGQTVVVQAARYLDVATGQYVTPARILVVDGKIAAINPDSVTDNSNVIDLGEMTLLPGLIDMHTHLCYDIEGEWVYRNVKEGPADWALRGARNARKTLLAGFTTVRDLGAKGFSDVSLMRAIDGGLVTGPSMFPSGHTLSITGGHADRTGYASELGELDPEHGVADGPEEVLRAVRYQIKHGARVIKICATAGVLSFEGPVGAQQYSEEEMRVIVEETARHGMKVAAHAHGSEGILAAVRAGVASIEHGSMLTDEIIAEMKLHGTWHVPTTWLVDALDLDALPPQIRAKAEYILPIARKNLEKSIASGVKIAFGTDAAVYPHGDNAKEFSIYVKLGMSPSDAIRTATTSAAELLGVADRGQIAAGLRADLIGVSGDPLANIVALESVGFVMKEGTVYKRGE